MQLVREHINEKFIEKSDAIKDLGIGQMTTEQGNQMAHDFLDHLKKTWNIEFEKISSRQITARFDPISDDIIILSYRQHSALDYNVFIPPPDSNLYQVYLVMNMKAANVVCSHYKNKDLKNKIPFGWILRTKRGIEYVEIDELDTLYKKVLQYAFPDISKNLQMLNQRLQIFQKEIDEMKKIKDFLKNKQRL